MRTVGLIEPKKKGSAKKKTAAIKPEGSGKNAKG